MNYELSLVMPMPMSSPLTLYTTLVLTRTFYSICMF